MLDDCMVDFKVVFQRMQEIEKYEKARLTKRQNNSINRFTLIFTFFLFSIDTVNVINNQIGSEFPKRYYSDIE